MRRLLMATAAAIALAVAAPLATAQYTTPPPATAPYTTPIPDDPMTPQDESLSAQPNTMATHSHPQTATTPGTPELQDPAVASATQPYDVQGQVGVGSTQAQTGVDSTVQAQTGTTVQSYDSQTQLGATTQSYGQSDTYASQAEWSSPTTLASLEQHARDAGMDGLPMNAMDVCAPREVSLTASGTRLSRDKQHQLINAADRASVCEFRRVVINSPNGRADQARQLLVEHGVDASLIEVQTADTGGLEVEMHFAGIATSSDQYAQIFNPQQYASYQPSSGSSYQPYADPSASAYQPSASANPSMQPYTTAPSTSSSEGLWLGDPNVHVPQAPSDGLSPTSGEPAVSPELYDI